MRADEKQAVQDEARRMVEEARGRFRQGVEAALDEARQLATVFERAVGDLASETALEAWRMEMITALKTASHNYVHSGGAR